MSDSASPMVCGTFTRARRYPLVVARVWGRRITLNFAVGVALGVGLMWLTRGVWERGPLADRFWMVYGVAGILAGAFLHRGRLDGRAPLWTIYTVLTWVGAELPRAISERISVRTVEVTVPTPPTAAVVPLPVQPRPVRLWVTPKTEAA